MTTERWQQVKAVFDRALQCDPASRVEFLHEQCENDPELLKEVELLLTFSGQAGSVLERPVGGSLAMAAAAPGSNVRPPDATSRAVLILADRYAIERELGRGGMSVVYLAHDRQLLSKRVVIKVLLDETSIDPWIRQKFLQEMEALARIDHPGVVSVLDTGLTPEGKSFLVMQYIEGTTLRGVIEPGGMNLVRAAGLIRQIGQALSAAHEQGVWHRDLKPENIMLQRLGGEDHVKLIDFGIAGIQNSRFIGEKTRVAGSVTYMAPEQFTGQACAASDTYALGVVAYELLTGTLPGLSGELRSDLPEAARRSIQKAMSFRPELRHSEVREFSEELYRALTSGEPARRTAVPGAIAMAHVLFTDLVGYSLLPMDQQKEYLGELQQIVRQAPQFRSAEEAGEIISLPTGDGMALAFFGDPTAPAQCALEVAAALKSKPHLKLRMGIHGGPVYKVADVNANANVAGGGINMAQRVMDCGDAGHILVSKSVADVLLQLSQWSPYLTDLGECTVKHGVKVHVWNLATAELGNPELPRKLPAAIPKRKSKAPLTIAVGLLGAIVAGALWFALGRNGSQLVQDKASIAVLPFVDMSPEKNQEYFSDGLADELLNGLAKVPGLRVAGRTSSFQFKGKTDDFRVIGRKLNVATMLEGSVRKQSNRARIAVQLVKAEDGIQMWSDSYDREINDIFAVQAEIARAVTGALKVTLLGKNTAGPFAKTTDAEAYNAYLQGRFYVEHRNKQNLEKAVGYFEQAIKIDPSYAPAWVGLGEARSGQASQAYVPTEEGFRKAREAIARALELDPELGQAQAAMAWIKMNHDWDWAGADAIYQHLLALEPGNARFIGRAGSLDRFLGRFDKAIALYRRSIQIDPLNSIVYRNAGVALYYAGRNEEARAAFQKVLELTPEMEAAHGLLGLVDLADSRPVEALAEMQQEKHPGLRVFGLALAYHVLGRKTEADAKLAELIAQDATYQVAEVYAVRGETDRAFEWLERSYAQRDPALNEIKGNPLLKSLERDPRYTALLEKMRLPI